MREAMLGDGPLHPPDHVRHDVRMDGVFFRRASLHVPFAGALDPGNYSYCVMVREGGLRLETDFPETLAVDLGPGDAIAVSGLVPHVFRSPGAAAVLRAERFETHPMREAAASAEIELVIGVAPNESLALGSLMVGPIVVRRSEHPDLSRRLWKAVEMLEEEYADASWIDRNLVVRRLAEIMMVNFSRRLFADRRRAGGAPASRHVVLAIDAFLREPERAWTLAELARAAGMSRTRFVEEFKLVTGQSPGRIVSRMRLTAAAHRLAREHLSVESAADEAGYSSSAAFVRAFQREFGETPARWRRHQTAFPNVARGASPFVAAIQEMSAR
ncbi:MAG: helix-turn-helix transcriptional regulator [Caulobacteraceae bacterium]|nr:helix-turn-helix transcriptional regulator [Caulobacteraceae bacterium]